MSSKGCPPVTVNTDKIVQAAKELVLSELRSSEPLEAEVQASHMGKLVPSPSEFSGTNFVVGYSTLPPVIAFASKLADEGILLPKIDKALFRGVATGLNLLGQLATGGSFLLGSLLGQLPMTLDAMADVAVSAIKKARAPVPAPAAAQGIGQTPEDEVAKLRADLERAGVAGHLESDDAESEVEMGEVEIEEEMAGARSGRTMIVD